MAKRYGKKKVWKTVGTIALAAVVCVGAVAGIGALVNRNDDGFEKVHVSYEIGGLDASGKYEETKATLYTKEGFDVTDMETVFADIDFNSTISYQLFYYGENDTFIESTSVLTDDYKDDVPEGALTCRVEITPIWKEDTKADDQKVTWLNKGGFADQLKLSVKAAETEESSEA